MWFIAFLFCALLGIWSAVLWLVLPIDIFDYALPSIAAMHLLPPLLLLTAILLAARWFKRRQLTRAQAAQEIERSLRAAEKNVQKKQWYETIAQRRAGVDCRWAAIADVIAHGGAEKVVPNSEQAFTRFYSTPETTPRDWPLSTIAQLLEELFAELPLASCLPLAIVGPSHQEATDIADIARQAHTLALQRLQIKPHRLSLFAPITLPPEKSPHKTLTELFAHQPAWPGVIVLAFDSPWRQPNDNDAWQYHSGTEAMSSAEKWRGKPGRAVTVMLITPDNLNSALEKLATLDDGVTLDNMTPFWEREQIPTGMASFLMQLPLSWRERWLQLAVIARLHRPASAEIDFDQSRNQPFNQPFNQRIQLCREIIATAAIDAALVEPDFEFDDIAEPGPQPSIALSDCRWLIHNAGNIAYCGDRMALLLSALWQEGVELDLDRTTNTVMALGDCGASSPWLWLALGIQRVAIDRKPVAGAHFQERALSLHFLMPPRA